MPLSARRAASGTDRIALNFLIVMYIAASLRLTKQDGTSASPKISVRPARVCGIRKRRLCT